MNDNADIFSTICSWQWERWDYDDCQPVAEAMAFPDVVNNLAMCGGKYPAISVVALLAAGKLTAVGSWVWQEYKDFEHYQNEGHGVIPQSRWESLLKLQNELNVASFDDSIELSVNLVEVGTGETDKFYFNWREGSFSLADASEDERSRRSEYWFSASNIQVLPPQPDGLPTLVKSIEYPERATNSNGGGRPTALDWEAVALEMAGRYYRGDLKPQTIADVISEIQKWANRADGGPTENTVRPHAKRIFEAFKSWEAEF